MEWTDVRLRRQGRQRYVIGEIRVREVQNRA